MGTRPGTVTGGGSINLNVQVGEVLLEEWTEDTVASYASWFKFVTEQAHHGNEWKDQCKQ